MNEEIGRRSERSEEIPPTQRHHHYRRHEGTRRISRHNGWLVRLMCVSGGGEGDMYVCKCVYNEVVLPTTVGRPAL